MAEGKGVEALDRALRLLDGFGADREDTRRRGYAVSLGERDAEVAAVSMPIFAKSGRRVGTLAVSGQITRFGPDLHGSIVEALTACKLRLEPRISG